jgi:hypothetical protein
VLGESCHVKCYLVADARQVADDGEQRFVEVAMSTPSSVSCAGVTLSFGPFRRESSTAAKSMRNCCPPGWIRFGELASRRKVTAGAERATTPP